MSQWEEDGERFQGTVWNGQCRDCHCEILWVRTNRGVRPCDMDEVEYCELEDGYVLVEPGGEEYRCDSELANFGYVPPKGTTGFIRHFETCSKGDRDK